jgi:hypothetical protein
MRVMQSTIKVDSMNAFGAKAVAGIAASVQEGLARAPGPCRPPHEERWSAQRERTDARAAYPPRRGPIAPISMHTKPTWSKKRGNEP